MPVVLMEAVQAVLKDETVRDDRMHDMGNGMIVKMVEGVVLDRDEDDQEPVEEWTAEGFMEKYRKRLEEEKKVAAAGAAVA